MERGSISFQRYPNLDFENHVLHKLIVTASFHNAVDIFARFSDRLAFGE